MATKMVIAWHTKFTQISYGWTSLVFRGFPIVQHQKASGNKLIIELVEFRMYSGGAIRDIDKRRKTPKMSHVANQKKKKKNHVTSYLGKTFIFF